MDHLSRCRFCGRPLVGKLCGHCLERKARHEELYLSLMQKFRLRRGLPIEPGEKNSLEAAERQIRLTHHGILHYRPEDLLQSESWWYVPAGWIGCMGFIVDKKSGYVNWLGSSSNLSLEHCLWGHDRGLYCDLVDFSFAPDTDIELARALFPIFLHMRPNARGVSPKTPIPYRDSELDSFFQQQFPSFKRHFVWYAIPDIQKAYKDHGLRFISNPSTAT
jgi:hypothetical protein